MYQRYKTPASLTESARAWYLQHRQATSTDVEQQMLSRYWEKAETLQTDSGNTILIVPLPDPPVDNKALAFRRFLVFEPNGADITDGRIVEILGDKYHVANQTDLLLTGRASSTIPGFNGSILQYDVNYSPLENATYVDGKKKTNTQTSILKFSPRDLTSPLQKHNGRIPVSSLRPGRYVIEGHIYTVKGMAPYNTLQIEDNDSLVNAFFRHPQNHRQKNVRAIGNETIMHSFTQVLGQERMRQLAASGAGNLIVTLYFTRAAQKIQPAAVSLTVFQPNKNNLTLNEINRINLYLKNNMALEVAASADQETQVWPLAQAIDFNKIDN